MSDEDVIAFGCVSYKSQLFGLENLDICIFLINCD